MALSAVQQALIERVSEYIAQYTPSPRIITYKPNERGDVMGRFESQGRVFTFRLSSKGLVYKPLIERKDNESDQSYALRFDTGSELYLEHFVRLDKTAPQRGTRKDPKCSAISYQCGVCISLGKNCIKNANTAALKERLTKINSLARMAAKGEAVPQVKTGVIGAKVDPKSLMRKAQAQARELAKESKSTTSPEKLSNEQIKALNGLTGGKTPSLKGLDKASKQRLISIANELQTLELAETRDNRNSGWRKTSEAASKRSGERSRQRLMLKLEVESLGNKAKDETKAKQAALRAAAEPNKTTTLATPFPLTAKGQKMLENGSSVTDYATYQISKKGDKYAVTDLTRPLSEVDKPPLIMDKDGLRKYMKELEARPQEVKGVQTGYAPVPITNDPDAMLRAMRNGRIIGDRKQGYLIQEHPTQKGDYLMTTEPFRNADYNAVMSRKEVAAFIKGGGDASKYDKKAEVNSPTTLKPNSSLEQFDKMSRDELISFIRNNPDDKGLADYQEIRKQFSDKWDKANDVAKREVGKLYGYDNAIYVPSTEAKKNQLRTETLWSTIAENGITQAEKGTFIRELPKDKASLVVIAQKLGIETKGKKLSKIAEAIADKAVKEPKSATPKQSNYIPLTSGKNLTPAQKKASRSTNQIAIDRAKKDVGNATRAINKLDDSIRKLKAGGGMMSEADLKKMTQLEQQKSEWETKRAGYKAKVDKLAQPEVKPQVQGTGETEAERRQFLLNTNAEESRKAVEPKREIELADIKTPQDKLKYANQELAIAKASKDPERINKWIDEVQRAKKGVMASTQAANNTYQPDLFFVNKGNPAQRSLFDSAEYDDSVERNILTNIGLMLSRAISGNQTSPNSVQLRKVKYADGNVTGIFTQYGSQFDFEITAKGIVINPLQVRQDRISGIAYKKTAKIGANRKCQRGYKCKGTCISKNNKCRVDWASRQGLEQFKSMQAELDNLRSPRFIEIDGRQVAQRQTDEDRNKLQAMNRRVAEARDARKAFADDYKSKTAKTYKIIGDRVNAEVERRLKDANLSPKQVKSTLAELDPKDIAVDPKRFQYKITGEHTASGTVGSLQGVGKWDENLAGILQVWKDPADGKTYVVNGHNRLSKANELGAEKVAVRYLDVPTHQEARTIGAMTNIAEGHGTALDAAKFFRDTNWTKDDVVKKGIPLKEKIATDGLAIASLEANLFRQVIDGELPIERAAIIGGNGLSHEKQKSLMELLAKRKSINNSVLSELIDTVKNSGQKQEEQFDLFGNSTATVDLAIQRASLQSHIKQKLGSEKKLFSTVSKSKSAKDLERGGNQIDVNQSSKIADEAATALKMFDTIKHMSGGVSDALNSASERLANAKTKAEKEKINRETYEIVLKEIQRENDKLFKTGKRSDSRQRSDSGNLGQPADCILSYIQDNSGNMMGICQIRGIKYRFLKPVIGSTVLTPLSETGLGYLFDMAPDLSLMGC